MLTLVNYEGKANQNHSEMPQHTHQNGSNEKDRECQIPARTWSKLTHTLLVKVSILFNHFGKLFGNLS